MDAAGATRQNNGFLVAGMASSAASVLLMSLWLFLGRWAVIVLWSTCAVGGLTAGALLLCYVQLVGALRTAQSSSALQKRLQGVQTVGFFHPYCAAGGGGERVLWCAVHSVQQEHKDLQCVVYTGDIEVSDSEMLASAESRFGVRLRPESVHFAKLTKRRWVEASTWPRFTLLGQSVGSLLLAWEALCSYCPTIMVDSMGYAFTFPLFVIIGGCRMGCYVHYPTISTDMLARVRARDTTAVCNDAKVARSRLLSMGKLVYYRIFAVLYGMVGRYAEVVMVNSSWTRGHIDSLWRIPDRTRILFPPCDTRSLAELPLERQPTVFGGQLVMSLAQFRPEKDHPKQLRAFAKFLAVAPQHRVRDGGRGGTRLVVVGGCRDDGDRGRLEALRGLAAELGLRTCRSSSDDLSDAEGAWDVAFCANLPLKAVRTLLSQAAVGLHTMRDEHFGIGVVEFMAAGAVALAHESAGPAMDIVVPLIDGRQVGFLATDEAGYAEALQRIFAMTDAERLDIAAAARQAVGQRFAEAAFERSFAAGMVAPLRRRGPATQ